MSVHKVSISLYVTKKQVIEQKQNESIACIIRAVYIAAMVVKTRTVSSL